MADKAKKHNLVLKPHFKTHQSADIGTWFRREGVSSITVSSVSMAEYFASSGWESITIAFPANIRQISRLNSLAGQTTLSLLLSDKSTLSFLDQNLQHGVDIYLEIDTGGRRSGIDPEKFPRIEELKDGLKSSSRLSFKGFYSHPGHSYEAGSKEEIHSVHRRVLEQMNQLKKLFPGSVICIGDTPCCSVADNFEGIDEISPGNFVFYDLMQARIGSCTLEEIAVALAAPVVSKNPDRKEVTVHCGAVHLSKDVLEDNGDDIFGVPVPLTDEGWGVPYPGSCLRALSQEHGILSCSSSLFEKLKIGSLIGILPLHSCLTADLMGGYLTINNKNLDHFRTFTR